MSRTARHRHSLFGNLASIPVVFSFAFYHRDVLSELCLLLLIRRERGPLRLPRFLSYALEFPYANIITSKFCRLYARISLLRGKLMHKVYNVFISRFLVFLKISNSCSPSLLNKNQITFREWTPQGWRRRLEHWNAILIRLPARLWRMLVFCYVLTFISIRLSHENGYPLQPHVSLHLFLLELPYE